MKRLYLYSILIGLVLIGQFRGGRWREELTEHVFWKADTLFLSAGNTKYLDLSKNKSLFFPSGDIVFNVVRPESGLAGTRLGRKNMPYAYLYVDTIAKDVKVLGPFIFGLGYPETADTVIINGVKYAPQTGMTYVDTTGGDTLKIYLNGTWVVVAP